MCSAAAPPVADSQPFSSIVSRVLAARRLQPCDLLSSRDMVDRTARGKWLRKHGAAAGLSRELLQFARSQDGAAAPGRQTPEREVEYNRALHMFAQDDAWFRANDGGFIYASRVVAPPAVRIQGPPLALPACPRNKT